MNVYFRKEKIIENNTGYDMSNTVKDCIVEFDEEYGPCSASCGGGSQELGYTVLQEPKDGYWNGKPKAAILCPPTQNRPCNEQPCPINCEGDWGPWLPCQKDDGTPAKCGGGKRLRSYNITKPAVDGYIDGVLTPGTACPYNNDDIQEEDCNVKPCAIDCVGAWGPWSLCNKDTGKKFKTYNVDISAQDGYIYNTDQVEEEDEAKPCDYTDGKIKPENCDVDCEYKWGSEWIVNEKNGTKTRNPVISVYPKNDGTLCPDSQTQKAKVNCVAKEVWGHCLLSSRYRAYNIIVQQKNGGTACPTNNGYVGNKCMLYCPGGKKWYCGGGCCNRQKWIPK